MKKDQTKTITYLALYVALYVVLKYVGNMIPFLQMPNGGSIELELIAVFIASYHLGWQAGLSAAILSWLITYILGVPMWFVHPIQIGLDYVGPLAVCGMASLLWPFKNMNRTGYTVMAVVLGAAAFFGIRYSFPATGTALAGAAVTALLTFAFVFWYLKEEKQFGIVISMLMKYILQVLSGVYYWFPEGSYAGSPAAWGFSLGYNLWYNLVTLVVCIMVVPAMIDRLKKARVTFKV